MMGNPRSFTTKFNANKEALERLLKAAKCTSHAKRKAAFERAITMPNSLPPLARTASLIQGEGK